MGITRITNTNEETQVYRNLLRSFTQDESAIAAVREYMTEDGRLDRRGMYALEIINNLIKQNNEKVFQRIPSEISGALRSNSRTAVAATVLCRARYGTGGQAASGSVRRGYDGEDEVDSGDYTPDQKAIGEFSERCHKWEDRADEKTGEGRQHNPDIDGSEAKVYFDKTNKKVYKTIECSSHFSNMSMFLDSIHIHNAAFPDTAITIEGFGLRDDAVDNTGFVAIVSQPWVKGRKASREEINDHMSRRGFDLTDNGVFFVNPFDNIVIWDVSRLNSVISTDEKTGEEALRVYDCDAALKVFSANKLPVEKFWFSELRPDNNGNYPEEPWKRLLGNDYPLYSKEEKSKLIKELRLTGKAASKIDGKIIKIDNPIVRTHTIDGKAVKTYEGTIVKGSPVSLQPEHLYTIPPLTYDQENLEKVKDILDAITPASVPVDEFLYDPKYVGEDTARKYGGGYNRDLIKKELSDKGRIEGLVNGKWLVSKDPENPENVLVLNKKNVQFILWTYAGKLSETEGDLTLTRNVSETIANGKTYEQNGAKFYFNLDCGFIDRVPEQRKLGLKKNQLDVDVTKRKHTAKKHIM